VYAAIIGGVVGLVGLAFEEAVNIATAFRQEYAWLLYLLPVAGLITVAIYRALGITSPKGTDRIILESQKGAEGVALRVAPIIFISTTLSHLTGASVGREGAALQLGGSIASFIGRKLRLPYRDNRTIIKCGMAAGFSALFGTPITAGIFALEVAGSEIHYTSIYPVMLSSVVAGLVSRLLGGSGTFFELVDVPELSVVSILQTLIFGLVIALMAIIFVFALEKSIHLFSNKLSNQYIKAAIGGIVVVIITLLIGNRDYNGAGMEVIRAAVSGTADSYAFLLKMIITVLCVASGFKGGEIVPTLFIGATFGCVFAPLIGLCPEFGAALGMIGLFCGVTNCPVASIFLAFEIFGGGGLVLITICCIVSYTMSGDFSLYGAQILDHPKFRNRNM